MYQRLCVGSTGGSILKSLIYHHSGFCTLWSSFALQALTVQTDKHIPHAFLYLSLWSSLYVQLSQVCQAITNLSDDHHNLRRLVQLLPHSDRGKWVILLFCENKYAFFISFNIFNILFLFLSLGRQLRRHVSVSIISKLLNHRCTYTPSCTEFQVRRIWIIFLYCD